MTQYSNGERMLARVLSAFPGLKKFLKWVYQYLNYALHNKRDSFSSDFDLMATAHRQDRETFFGYYDTSPLNTDGDKVIYHITTHKTTKAPDPNYPVDIAVQDWRTGDTTIVASTPAYNWQQGAKLQWLTNTRFIYNTTDPRTGGYCAEIYDTNQKQITDILPFPIYDCHRDEYALSLNYDRLAEYAPDYGYTRMVPAAFRDSHDTDGLFVIDLKTKTHTLLTSLTTIIAMDPASSMTDAEHSVNHIMISPNGETFMFIHRWYHKGVRFDRLIVGNRSGTNFKIVAAGGMVSHCFWEDDSTIVSYMRHEGTDGYYRINVVSDGLDVQPLAKDVLTGRGDGHPNIKGHRLVTDTYPDKARMKALMMLNTDTNALIFLGQFFESFKYYGVTRCDLHPRLDPTGNIVFFDSVHSGTRALYHINLTRSESHAS